MYVFITIMIVNACIAGTTIPATPENITVTFLTPTTVRVSWQTMIDLNAHPIEKYIVTYKPTDDRVVQDVAGNSEAIILDRLSPSTQYSVAVTAVWLGNRYRSRQVFFKTLDMPTPSSQQDFSGRPGSPMRGSSGIQGAAGGLVHGSANGSIYSDDITSTTTNHFPASTRRELPTIRGVEIGIVLIVLMVWAGAIALFFNRWGKIRMLLPYQPDYKHEQLKVPGTGVCTGGVCTGQHSHQQHFHMLQEEPSIAIAERCTRSRINSAIFVSSEGRGFDSIEFLRRHGSQSVLCRKARSAENITDNERKKSFSEKHQWRTNEEEEAEDASNEGGEDNGIEMKVTRKPAPTGSALGHLITAAVTTSNMVVGSISIETPPAHIKEESNTPVAASVAPTTPTTLTAADIQTPVTTAPAVIAPVTEITPFTAMATTRAAVTASGAERAPLANQSTFGSLNSNSHDSTDTVEELIVVPVEPTRSRVLVHQRTSLNRSQSPANSSPAHSSSSSSTKVAAAGLSLKCTRAKINTLPMVSVSGPSPTQEKPPPAECL